MRRCRRAALYGSCRCFAAAPQQQASGARAKQQHTEGQVRQHPPEAVCFHKVLHNVLSLPGFGAVVAVTDKRLQEMKSMGSRA